MHRFSVPDLGIRGHDPKVLASQLEYLRRRRYHLMSVGELVSRLDDGAPLEENALVFTVDDGYADFALVGAPVFAAYDCPVTVFLITDFVSGRLWNWFDRVEWAFAHSDRRGISMDLGGEKIQLRWADRMDGSRVSTEFIERLKGVRDELKVELIHQLEESLDVTVPENTPEEYRAMTWGEVRACASQRVTFGPHTVTHPILSRVDDRRADTEIFESWRTVAASTQAAVPVFCYPNGTARDFSSREKASVARAGMRAALSTMSGSLESSAGGIFSADRYAIPRFAYSENKHAFVQIASGLEERKTQIRRRFD